MTPAFSRRRRLGVRHPAVHGHRGQGDQLTGRGVAASGLRQRIGGRRLAPVPAESWAPASPKGDPQKTARRVKCRIPAEIGHVEKWQLALEMIDETRLLGVDVPVAVADGGYGDMAAFRRFREHHAFLARPYLDQYDPSSPCAAMALVRPALDLLDTIPGINKAVAKVITAESGGGMSRFASAKHFASWTGRLSRPS
ncbi:transposase [Streptomyces sp. NPDC058751]|uniref:transposase n=1 Tax=Streptomyces sp. NPDC058751 TaxID=3346623 RepID=UPI00367A5586